MTDKDVTTRADIYNEALKNFRRCFPQFDAYKVLASQLSISESAFRSKVKDDERHFTVGEEEMFFEKCLFPQGFIMKQALVFKQYGAQSEEK